ncbi:MAG: hypothetical protein OXG25_05300 [Gammaproteobacteria bacterium]|nr:hypothetical protein [Gammaproteobacteria bacterium]
MKTSERHASSRKLSKFAVCALWLTIALNGEEREINAFVQVSPSSVAFPSVERTSQFAEALLIRSGDWRLSVSREPDRQVLRAESGDKLVTQSITPNAVHKRFVFDLKRHRFEPMRQEIRIEHTDESALQQIEKLNGVSGVRRYQNLGFSIVKVNKDVNPVEVLRTLREVFASEDSRILTGFFDDEPM